MKPLKFKSRENFRKGYAKICARPNCILTNFGGQPFNWAAYAVLRTDKGDIIAKPEPELLQITFSPKE